MIDTVTLTWEANIRGIHYVVHQTVEATPERILKTSQEVGNRVIEVVNMINEENR